MYAGVCTTTRQLQAARSTQLTLAQRSMVPEWTRSLALHGTIERKDDATMQHTGERTSSGGDKRGGCVSVKRMGVEMVW